MADHAKQEAPKEEAPVPAKKKGAKTPIIVAGIMIAEAVGVFMVAKMTSPKAAEAATEASIAGEHGADPSATVELALMDDKFQNMQTGQVWIWDAEIVLKVKTRHEEAVSKVLESKGSEIKEGVAAIFRRAQHSALKEPGLETINRQLLAFVNQMVGKDGDGHDRVERVLIPRCRGFPAG